LPTPYAPGGIGVTCANCSGETARCPRLSPPTLHTHPLTAFQTRHISPRILPAVLYPGRHNACVRGAGAWRAAPLLRLADRQDGAQTSLSFIADTTPAGNSDYVNRAGGCSAIALPCNYAWFANWFLLDDGISYAWLAATGFTTTAKALIQTDTVLPANDAAPEPPAPAALFYGSRRTCVLDAAWRTRRDADKH